MTETSELSELFSEVAEDIQTSIRELGWQTPTPVQARAIPLMRGGGDLIVQAQTGSGKTGAFGIPLVEGIDTSIAGIQALVMLPTRELANQVAVELTTLGRHRGVIVLPVYGGTGYTEQVDALEAGVHIIVGTPGRILDHLGNGRMDLRDVATLVLDEADEMLSLGFWPDMREIASYLPESRQSHLFSATIPEKVRSLSRFFLNDAEFVAIDDGLSAPQQIEHFYYVCSANEKEALLARVLEFEDPESAIIFCNTKADVRFITGYLSKRGFNADQISGDLAQAARERALRRIKSGELRFLVATDVAARGIDISDLSHVISYATADAPEVYVHRTGRTGRAGKAGIAISLVSGLDIGNFKHMQNVNKIEVAERKPPTEKDMLNRIRERIQVKVEHEMRGLTPAQADFEVNRLIPVVEEMATSHEGRRDLAGICAAYLSEHRPETTIAPDAPENQTDAAATSENRKPGGSRRGGGGGGRGGQRGGGGGSGGSGGGGGGRRRSGGRGRR
ncbi:MAG: DEAD/DEAH box helicase [Myxococcota bacterium]|nr:DEAD/DEAH box helicase [Myxococcota bacterium]